MNTHSLGRMTASLALVIGLAHLTSGPSAEAATGLSTTTVRGTNFLIKSQADLNFCIEADPGTGEGPCPAMRPSRPSAGWSPTRARESTTSHNG